MASGNQLHILDNLLRDVMLAPEIPFGGKILILGADFRQVLPTIIKGSRSDIVDASITLSNLFPLFQVRHLIINKRAEQDAEYADWIFRVGEGRENVPRTSEIVIPREFGPAC